MEYVLSDLETSALSEEVWNSFRNNALVSWPLSQDHTARLFEHLKKYDFILSRIDCFYS